MIVSRHNDPLVEAYVDANYFASELVDALARVRQVYPTRDADRRYLAAANLFRELMAAQRKRERELIEREQQQNGGGG